MKIKIEQFSWNTAGFTNYLQIDTSMCEINSFIVTIKESGKYLISMSSFNSSGGGTPSFQLYRNEIMIKQYKNNSTASNVTRTSMEISL